MSKHHFWLMGLPLILGGCLPLPITIASSAITGISYLTTGKSGTDHVISAAREEDCSLLNPFFGDDVCGDLAADDDTYAAVAAYPGDRDSGGQSNRGRAIVPASEQVVTVSTANRDIRAQGHQEKLAALSNLMAAPPLITVAGLSLSSGEISGLAKPRAGIQTANAASSTTWSSTTGPKVPTRAIEVAPLPAPSAFDAPVPTRTAAAVVGSTGVKVPLANTRPASEAEPVLTPRESGASSTVNRTSPTQKQPLPRVEVGSMGDSGRYIVVGSFRERSRADLLAASLADHTPKILAATVKGERWNRVAIGPLDPARVAATKAAIGSVSGREPWVVRLDNPIILAGN